MVLNAPILWLVIFWVGYETRACARFIETLSDVPSLWPTVLLDREEAATGVPRTHLDDYLDFKLIVLATQRIHWLIYLPFVSILFMVLSRSDLFDTMNFPLALVFVTGLALAYALYSAVLLRRSAESARAKALEHRVDVTGSVVRRNDDRQLHAELANLKAAASAASTRAP